MEKSRRVRMHSFSMRLDNRIDLLLDSKTQDMGMTKSEFLRNIILFATTEERAQYSSGLAEDIHQELNHIGNTVNEIAHSVNSRGKVRPLN